MAARLAILFLVLISLLTFHECDKNNNINVNGDKLDRSVTTSNKIILSPCSHTWLTYGWCCITVHPILCYKTREYCLAYCPSKT
ncbi:hypothetical protein GQ457_15G010460 [Hibiscus cannabinus]